MLRGAVTGLHRRCAGNIGGRAEPSVPRHTAEMTRPKLRAVSPDFGGAEQWSDDGAGPGRALRWAVVV